MDEQTTFEPKAVLAPRRAGWNRVAILVPALALAATSWVGFSGQRSSAESAAKPSDAPIVAASNAPVVGPPVRPPGPVEPGYPARVLGLDVQALDDLQRYPPRDDLTIAIAGWYAAGSVSACPAPTDLEQPGFVAELGVDARVGTFCRRSGLLFASSPANVTALPALTVVMTPGIVLPPALDDIRGGATQVVLIGRLADERQCLTCMPAAGFVWQLHVDRVVWAAGLGRAQTTSILPSVLDGGPLLSWGPRHRLADATMGPTGAILMETLVDPATLGAVDPAAAAAVAASSPYATRIWYRRTLGPDPAHDAPPWIAIDDTTGEVIGTSRDDSGLQPG